MDAAGPVQERASHAHGARRLASAVDREATFRKHGSDPAVFGANAVISTTATHITACIALTGCTPDSDAPEAVLRQLQDADQALPEALIMDQAGGWGTTRATVAAISDGQTRMVAQIPTSGGSDPNRFRVAAFQVDPDRTTCTCPHGVVSTRAYAHGDSDGITFRFLASQCRGCPLWSQCRDPQAKPTSHRTVFISDDHIYLRQAQQANQTPEGVPCCSGGAGRSSRRLPGWCATRAVGRRAGWGCRPPNASSSRPVPCAICCGGWGGWPVGARRVRGRCHEPPHALQQAPRTHAHRDRVRCGMEQRPESGESDPQLAPIQPTNPCSAASAARQPRKKSPIMQMGPVQG